MESLVCMKKRRKLYRRRSISKGLQLFEWIRYLFLRQGRNLAPLAVLR